MYNYCIEGYEHMLVEVLIAHLLGAKKTKNVCALRLSSTTFIQKVGINNTPEHYL